MTVAALSAHPAAQAGRSTDAVQQDDAVPVKIEVVLSRSKNGTQVSSLPFTLMLTAGSQRPTSVRMGVDVPVGTTTSTRNSSNSEQATTTSRPEYKYVGTQLDCSAALKAGGRYDVWVSVTDSSIYSPQAGTTPNLRDADALAFRNFSMGNSLSMALGETKTFALATDKISGETLKIDVTLTAAK